MTAPSEEPPLLQPEEESPSSPSDCKFFLLPFSLFRDLKK